MKNILLIILILIEIALFGAWFYFNMFIFMLVGLFIGNLHILFEIKNKLKIKIHLALNITLFIISAIFGYFLEEYSLIVLSLFLIHTSYIYYKNFKNS